MAKTFTGRLAVFMIVGIALTLGITTYLERSIHTKRLRQSYTERYHIVARQALNIMLLAMKREPVDSIEDFLASLCSGSNVELIRVLDTQGTIKHSSRIGELGQRTKAIDPGLLAARQAQVLLEDTETGTAVRILEPIVNEAKCQSCHGDGNINGIFEVRLDRRFTNEALGWAWDHPGRAAHLAWIKFTRIWNIWPNEPAFRGWFVRLGLLFSYLPLLVLSLVGGWRFTAWGWPYVLAWLPAVYLTMLHVVFVGSIRYREPAMMALTVLAAGVLAGSTRWARARDDRSAVDPTRATR